MSADDWRAARSVLAIRLDGMGDLLMTTPALRALKEAVPGRRLTLLASPAGARLARALSFVDDVIPFAAPWMKQPEDTAVTARMLGLVAMLRGRRFDAGVVLTVFTQSALPAALVLLLAGVPLRAAYCRENPYALLTDWRPDPDRDAHAGVRHEVRRQIDLVESLGLQVRDTRLHFPIRDDARRSMRAKARAAGMRSRRRWLVVHPGATAASRRYPDDKLIEAVAALQATGRFQIAIAGGECDVACANAIATSVDDVVVLAGRLHLPELAALIDAADVVVCNNSAPAHIAAAVGTPVVDLYALTNPQHTPWRVAHRVLSRDVDCKYCLKSVCPLGHHRCLADVSPDEIVAAVETLVPDATNQRRRAPMPVAALAQP